MLTQKRLKELLKYDPKTGIFIWRVDRRGGATKGDKAGNLNSWGYLRVTVDGKEYKISRLAFLYVKGYFPEYFVDHKYGDRIDNRWKMIRHTTNSCNSQNSKIRSDNTSGFKGVYKSGTKWSAGIKIKGEKIGLGRYENKLDAAIARLEYEIACPEWHCDIRQESTKAVLKSLKRHGRKKKAKKLKKKLKQQ